MDESLQKLTNPEFDFEWNGKTYRLRKASLRMTAAYEARMLQDSKNGIVDTDALRAAYAIYLMLKPHEPELTEDMVLDNTPGDVFVLDLLETLGFMNPTLLMEKLQSRISKTTLSSSSPSPTDSDGPQTK